MSENRPVDEPTATSGPAGAPSVGSLANPLAGDWPGQAADTIVRAVGQVRDRTTGPAITAARGVVYGILAGFLGVLCLVLFIIAAVRILDSYVVGEDNTWLAHLIVGVAFTAGGLFMWSKRRPSAEG